MGTDGTNGDGDGAERRRHERFDTELSVDFASGENFLFSYITNISEMGIFIRSDHPMAIGTTLRLRFGLDDDQALQLEGTVVWFNPVRADGDNPNPGMGVRFTKLTPEQRERVVAVVRTVAYLQSE